MTPHQLQEILSKTVLSNKLATAREHIDNPASELSGTGKLNFIPGADNQTKNK
jgi:hypothetical protein